MFNKKQSLFGLSTNTLPERVSILVELPKKMAGSVTQMESSARKLITGPLGKGTVHLGKRVHGPVTQLNGHILIPNTYRLL